MEDQRAQARAMAADAIARGDCLGWFEDLYGAAEIGDAAIPWADLHVNPQLTSWSLLDAGRMRRTLVVGCGLGDDAEWLAGQGLSVTAFDISATAVSACRRRFPHSPVQYVQADLLAPPAEWISDPFDLVVESYTIQVLPPGSAERAAAFESLVRLCAHVLLVIARARADADGPGSMPWPLTRPELDRFVALGMHPVAVEDYFDGERPPVRRFRATYARSLPWLQ